MKNLAACRIECLLPSMTWPAIGIQIGVRNNVSPGVAGFIIHRMFEMQAGVLLVQLVHDTSHWIVVDSLHLPGYLGTLLRCSIVSYRVLIAIVRSKVVNTKLWRIR